MAENLQKDDWKDVTVEAFNGGLNVEKRADQIQDSESPNLENIWLDKSYVKVDKGYATFAGTVRGEPRKTYQFQQQDGTTYHVLITDDTFYREIGDAWQYVSNGTDTTLTADLSGGATSCTVADITDFGDGEYIGITLDDGSQHQTTVNGAPAGSTINFDDAVPGSGVVASIGKAVVEAVALSSSLDDQISLIVMPAYDWMIFTNNADNVKRFDGSTLEDVPNLPSSGNTQCKAVVIFNNVLLLLNTTEGGTSYPQRVRGSEIGDPTIWSGGNSFYEDLFERADELRAGGLLGPYLVIYRSESITRGTWVGSSDTLISFKTVVTKAGCLGPEAFNDVKDFHAVMWRAGIYKYEGGLDIDASIDLSIHDKVFGSEGELTPSFRGRTVSVYIEDIQESWFLCPMLEAETLTHILRYRHVDGAWVIRKLTHNMTGVGLYVKDSSLTWQAAEGDWLNYTYPWRSVRTLANSTSIMLCGESPKQVYEYDYVTPTDAGTDIDYVFETKDFIQAGFFLRVDWIDLYICGGESVVSYSTDSGSSWTEYGTVPACPSVRAHRLEGDNGQFTEEKVRWRVTGTAEGFKLGWFKMHLKLESQW